jgi:hypothetical protein
MVILGQEKDYTHGLHTDFLVFFVNLIANRGIILVKKRNGQLQNSCNKTVSLGSLTISCSSHIRDVIIYDDYYLLKRSLPQLTNILKVFAISIESFRVTFR